MSASRFPLASCLPPFHAARRRQRRTPVAVAAIAYGALDRGEKLVSPDGLAEIVDRAGGHAPGARFGRVVRRDDDRGNANAAAGEMALQLEPGHFRHLNVEEQAIGVRLIAVERIEKLASGAIGGRAQPECIAEPAQADAYERLVIDDRDGNSPGGIRRVESHFRGSGGFGRRAPLGEYAASTRATVTPIDDHEPSGPVAPAS